MKYKINSGNDLYDTIVALWEKRRVVCKEADDLGLTVGASKVGTYGRNWAGGIDAFYFDYNKEPSIDLWSRVDRRNNPQLFYPKYGKKYKQNNELHNKISSLPIIKFDEINAAIQFKSQITCTCMGISNFKSFGISMGDGFILIDVDENCDYTPIENMIELTVSEYKVLKDSIKAE